MKPDEFAATILALKDHFPMSVTSWGRTPIHNMKVGGVPDSEHVKWIAVDVVLDDELYIPAFIAACEHVGLTAFWDKDHIHAMVPRVAEKEANNA